MDSSIQQESPPATARAIPSNSRFYAVAWRWHFYTGLYVIPFLMVLALTGLVMVFFTGFQSRLGTLVHVAPEAKSKQVTVQAKAALDQFPGATLKEYIAPKTPDLAGWFLVAHDGKTDAVAVNPYTAAVVKAVDTESTVFNWARQIHAKLLLGDAGGVIMEIAAGLAIVMIITGLYLFWPRQSAWSEVLLPDWSASGRKWWKSLHSSLGFWLSLILLSFLLTGLSWTAVWGGKFVQPWGTFPAVKWDNVPTSDQTHASLNTAGEREVPWGLEQTPLPVSGSAAGSVGVSPGAPVNLDGVTDLANRLGFSGQYHVNVPQDATGVYTISADTMSGDLENPFKDRTVHIDRYTGKVLAEAAFADYSVVAKGMAIGIALHQGDVGVWSAIANIVICISILVLCVSGIVMWWIRRPAGAARLGAPSLPSQAPFWKSGAIVMLVTAVLFPLSGAVLLTVLLLDWLVVSRIQTLKAIVS